MFTFEKALYEANKYTSSEPSRYAISHIMITKEGRIISTNGKCMYLSDPIPKTPIRNCCVALANTTDGNKFPNPKKPSKKGTETKIVNIESRQYLDSMDTRFVIKRPDEIRFPECEKIADESMNNAVIIDSENFMEVLSSTKNFAKEYAKSYLFDTGRKLDNPQQECILCFNGKLIMSTFLVYKDCKLIGKHMILTNKETAVDTTIVTFNPSFYRIQDPPVAVSAVEHAVTFYFPNRQVIICPIKEENPDCKLSLVQNLTHWI